MPIPEPGLIAIAALLGVLVQLACSPVRSLPELLAFALPTGLSALVMIALSATLFGVETIAPWAVLVGVAIVGAGIAAARPLAELGRWRRSGLAAGLAAIWLIAVVVDRLHAAHLSKQAHELFAASDAIYAEDLIGMLRLGSRFRTGTFALYASTLTRLTSADYLITIAPMAALSTLAILCVTVYRTAIQYRLRPRAAAIASLAPLLLAVTSFPLIQGAFHHDGTPLAAVLIATAAAGGWLMRVDRADRSLTVSIALLGLSLCTEFAPVLVGLLLAVGIIDVAAEPRRLPVAMSLAAAVCVWPALTALTLREPALYVFEPLAIAGAGIVVQLAWARVSWRPPGWLARGLALAALVAAAVSVDSIGADTLFRFDMWGAPFALGIGLSAWGVLRAPRRFLAVIVWAAVVIPYLVTTEEGSKLPPDRTLYMAALLLVLSAGVMVAGSVARLGLFGGDLRDDAPPAVPPQLRPRRVLGVLIIVLLSFHLVINLAIARSNTLRMSDRFRVWPSHDHFNLDGIKIKR